MADKPNRGTYGYNKEYMKKYRAGKTEIKLTVDPEQKARITSAAQTAGESVTRYMLTATQTRMENEKQED